MYKAYYYPTAHEYFFENRPKKNDLIECLKKDGDYDESSNLKEFEISKIKVILNGTVKKINK